MAVLTVTFGKHFWAFIYTYTCTHRGDILQKRYYSLNMLNYMVSTRGRCRFPQARIASLMVKAGISTMISLFFAPVPPWEALFLTHNM